MPDDSSRRSRARTAGFGLAALCLALFAVVTVVGSDGRACSLCHAPQSTALAASSHEGVGCYGCHLDGGAWGAVGRKVDEFTGMYPLALIGAGFRSPASETGRGSCLACHPDVLVGVTEGSGIRIAHASCAGDASCDECHSAVAHGDAVRWKSAAVMDECTACHRSRGAGTRCADCHTTRTEQKGPPGPWQVVHGPNGRATHGMADAASCDTCHGSGFCERCHGVALPHPDDFGMEHGRLAKAEGSHCLGCHSSAGFCDTCHGVPMPHPAGFIKRHATTTERVDDPSCTRCHAEGDCAACHTAHIHPGGSLALPRAHT